MAEFSSTPPNFDVKYDIGRVPDIGAGYAAGITEAGKGIAQGVSSALDVANRSRAAHDTLDMMVQSKMISPDDYAAFKGKSLSAQEAMIGMHANQWIAQQAQQRAIDLAKVQGAVQVGVETGKLGAYQKAFGAGAPVPGMDPRHLPWNPNLTNPQNQQNQQNQQNPPAKAIVSPPAPLAGAKWGYDQDTGRFGWQTKGGAFVPHQGTTTPSPGAPAGGLSTAPQQFGSTNQAAVSPQLPLLASLLPNYQRV